MSGAPCRSRLPRSGARERSNSSAASPSLCAASHVLPKPVFWEANPTQVVDFSGTCGPRTPICTPGAGLEPPFRAGALRPAWLRPIERAEGTLSDGAARPRRARSDRCIGHRQNELVRIVDGAAWSDSGSAPMPRAASTSLYCRTPHRISPTKRCGRAGSRPCATKAWRQSSMPIWSAGSPKNSVTAIRKRSRA